MTGPENDLRGIGISPRERLARIEALLEIVDAKLDGKASSESVVALALRVAALESNTAVLEQRNQQVLNWRDEVRHEIATVKDDISTIGRKLAYATGTLAVVVIGAQWILGRI